MTKAERKVELVENLKALIDHGDPECAHVKADDLLINFINESEVTEAYNAIKKW